MHPRTSFIEGPSAEGQPLLPRGQLHQQPYLPQAAAFIPPPAAPPSWAAASDAAAEPCPPLTVATVGKAAKTSDDDSNAKHQAQPAAGVPIASAPPQMQQPVMSSTAMRSNMVPPSGYQMWILPVGQEQLFPAQCPCCHYTGRLRVRKESGACTWLSAGLLCLVGAWPCAFLPFCCSITKDQVVRCPECGLELRRQLP